MNTRLCKEEFKRRIPVWVKIPNVTYSGFSSDNILTHNTSQIGKPIMLDSYTSLMCIESWRRSSFARCLIEINAEDTLKESLTIGFPLIEDTGFIIKTVTIEYEWKPPLYGLCKIFGLVHDHCPKKVSILITGVTSNVPTPTVKMTNDGFQTVGKKKKGKFKSTNGGQIEGHSVKMSKATTSAPKKGATNLGNASKSSSLKNQPPKATITSPKEGKITMSNFYAALEDESDEDVENVYDESANLFHCKIGKSSSTFMTAAR
ncbi:zinc knuckle CX2CX4HX4C containing protein [Tanacetum coccineum]|uniref:Zinc knuckle CX2CX4HX4C containing protein n=1 Tax=Tanacetum coccineum TaxID=301880 RepID=A0ABQ5AG96_9ASTR